MSDATLDFASEDMFASNAPVKQKTATMAAVEHDAIADDVTLQQCETQLRSIADLGASVLVEAEAIVVTDQASANAAGETAKQLNKIAKSIEEQRKVAVKPFNDIVDQINSLAKRIASPFSMGSKQVAKKALDWQNAEAMRIAVERRKQQQEAEAALLANKKPEPVLTVLPKEPPKAISTRKTITYEVFDFDLLPAKYKMEVVNEAMLSQDVKSEAVTAVPGVKIIVTQTPIFC